MNPRIFELAEQATRKYDRLGFEIPFAQPNLEVFAELIVKKCLAQCEEVADSANRMTKSQFLTDAVLAWSVLGEIAGAKNCSARIKEHFGVES